MNGLLLVDKPGGLTSHDVVLAVRRNLPRGVKVGHTGTLDPMASGLLVLLIGRATKSAALHQRLPKTYAGRIMLGKETDTGDLDGKVVRESPVPELSPERLQAAMDAFLGELDIPAPAFSAVKYKGKPLYAYARQGILVPPRPRTCRVFEWKLLDLAPAPPTFGFRLHCSHGTYARSLAVELGRRLETSATLAELRRQSIGRYSLDAALPLDAVLRLPSDGLAGRLLPA